LVKSAYIEAHAAFETSVKIWHSTFPHHFIPSLTALGLTDVRLGQLEQARKHLAQALEKAMVYRNRPPVLAALPACALLKAAENNLTSAIEIWGLANRHPLIANSKWFQDIMARDVQEWTAVLSSETIVMAQERGRGLDLWETAEALLQELQK
jgi:hypothetical protein